MKIWKLGFSSDEYDYLTTVPRWDFDKMRSFNGSSHLDDWVSIDVVNLEPEKGLDFGNAVTFYTSLPAFDDKAKTILEEYCKDFVEFLPLKNPKRKFWAVNITAVLDCINYEKSEYKTFADGKRIMYFEKYSFKPEVVENVHIFKLKDSPVSTFFVSDTFKKVVEENNLTGFNFKLVWDSEEK